MLTQSKLLDGLMKRMDSIFDEGDQIFFEMHPWLEDASLIPVIVETPELLARREQNHIDIEEIFNAIAKETERLGWSKREEVKPQMPAVQGILLS